MKRTLLSLSVLLVLCPFAARARAQIATPRRVAVAVRLTAPALFAPDGRPATNAAANVAALHAIVSELLGARTVVAPYAVTLPGVVCDELSLLRTTASRRTLTDLKRLVSTHPLLESTYGEASLSAMTPTEIQDATSSGRRALTTCSDAPRQPFVPAGVSIPTERVASVLHRSGVDTALSAFAVPPSDDRPRIVPVVEIAREGDVIDVRSDRPETDELAIVVDAQRADPVHVLTALAADTSLTLTDITALTDVDVIDGVIDTARPKLSRPLEDASASLLRFRSITLPDNRLAAIYRTGLARAAAPGSGRDAARRLNDAIRAQLHPVAITPGGVTFTSRRGSVPVTISAHVRYPLRVRITVSSPKLSFPTGSSRVIVVQPPGGTVTFEALARSSGTFPLDVVVTDPSSTLDLVRSELSVRSTAANIPAVVLTLGGAVFLFVWLTMRWRRKRSEATS